MKKFLQLSSAAALMLSASVALAQNGSDVTSPPVSNTVGGIFVPTGAGTAVAVGRVNIAVAPPATPVSVGAAPAAVGVMSGAPQAVANFTQALGTSGVPAGAATAIANAMQQVGTNPTAGSIQTAMATWNAALQSMTPAQVQALVSTPAGRAAVITMIRAHNGAIRAALQAARP